MKKTLIFAGLAMIASLASCTKTIEENIPMSGVPGIPVSLTVNDCEWTADSDTRTAYTAGTGVSLTGTELISLFYKSDKLYDGKIMASPTGSAGQYSFTMPETADGATYWTGIMPYSKWLVTLNSSGTSAALQLGPVQFPEADSFDPHCDYMVVKPFTVEGAAGAKTGEIASFKRLFAPLCVSVTGLPEGSKIYTATLSLSQAPSSTSALIGKFYITIDEAYANTKISSAEKTSIGNAVTAEYGSGLAAKSGAWPVWYMVNAITLNSGASLTMTVSTQDKTYTRTVTLPSAQQIAIDKLNKISFNMAGAGATSKASITQDFTSMAISSGTKSFTASDGNAYSWTTTSAREYRSSDDGGSGIKGAMMLAGTTVTLPDLAGKSIVGATVYTHPSSRSHTGKTVTLTVDGTDVYNLNLSATTASESATYKGGAIDIAVPAGKTSLNGLTIASGSTETHLISAITLYVQDDSIDPNDYYALFMAGEDIVIGGEVYNKTKYPVAPRLVKAYEMANANDLIANATTKGILFLDYDPADGEADVFTTGYNLKPDGSIIIGRYKNHQPVIDMVTNNHQIGPTAGGLVLKNVGVKTNGYALFTGNATTDLKVTFEDCEISTNGQYLFCETQNTYGIESLVINNCVLTSTRAIYAYGSAVTIATELPALNKISMTNSVFYSKASVAYPTFAFKVSSTGYVLTPDLDINLDHCSFYNVQSNNYGLISIQSARKVNVNYCVGEAALTNSSPMVVVPGILDPKLIDSTINGARFYNSNAAGGKAWAYGYSALLNSGMTTSGNNFALSASPFTKADTTTGYFPVNTSVVTNGAGCDYSKLCWKTWE